MNESLTDLKRQLEANGFPPLRRTSDRCLVTGNVEVTLTHTGSIEIAEYPPDDPNNGFRLNTDKPPTWPEWVQHPGRSSTHTQPPHNRRTDRMNLGTFRKLTEGMPDSAPFILTTVSSHDPDDDLNVVIEDIGPNKARDRVDIHLSILTDDALRAREDARIEQLQELDRQEAQALVSGEGLIDDERAREERTREQALTGLAEVCGGITADQVLFRLDSSMFNDVDDIPMLDDARHAFFCAVSDDDGFADSPWSNVLTEEEAEDDVNICERSFFAFDRDLTSDQQYVAIRAYLGLKGPPPALATAATAQTPVAASHERSLALIGRIRDRLYLDTDDSGREFLNRHKSWDQGTLEDIAGMLAEFGLVPD